MAIIVKSLANNRGDFSSLTNIYPASGTATRPALVKSMRFVNVSDSEAATLTLKLTHGSATKQVGRREIPCASSSL